MYKNFICNLYTDKMTNITITRKQKKIVSIVCDGHTDYGEEGEDIVCAALSSIVQTAVLGIMQVAQIAAEYKIDPKIPLASLTLPQNLTQQERNNADMILETMYLGIADLQAEYGRWVKLTERKQQ